MMMALRAIPIPIEESVRHLPSRALIDRSLPVFISMPDDVTKGVPMPHLPYSSSHLAYSSHLAFETRGILALNFSIWKTERRRKKEKERKREREKERKREREKERETAASWGHMRSFTS